MEKSNDAEQLEKRRGSPIQNIHIISVPDNLTRPVFGELLDCIMRFIETRNLVKLRLINHWWRTGATKELLKRKDHEITFTFCPESEVGVETGFVKEATKSNEAHSSIQRAEVEMNRNRKNPKTLADFNRLFLSNQDGEKEEDYFFPCVRFCFKHGDLSWRESVEFFKSQRVVVTHLTLNLRPAWCTPVQVEQTGGNQNQGRRCQSNVFTRTETLVSLLLHRLPCLEVLDIDSFPQSPDGRETSGPFKVPASVIDSIFKMRMGRDQDQDEWRFYCQYSNSNDKSDQSSCLPFLHTLKLPSFNCDLNQMKRVAEWVLFFLSRAPRLSVISFGWFFPLKLLPIFIATQTVHMLRTPCLEIRIFEDPPALIGAISESHSGFGSQGKASTGTKWAWDWVNNPIYLMKIHLETPPTPEQCSSDNLNQLNRSISEILRKSQNSLYEINFYGAAINFFVNLVSQSAQCESNPIQNPQSNYYFPFVNQVRVITTVYSQSVLEQLLPQSKSSGSTIPVWIFYRLFPAMETFYFRPQRDRINLNPPLPMNLCLPISQSYGGVNKLIILNACEQSLSRLTKAFSGFGYGPKKVLESVEMTCTDFPKVAPFLWKLRQLRYLKIVLIMNQEESWVPHSFPELDAAFTGFSTETVRILQKQKHNAESQDPTKPQAKKLKLEKETEELVPRIQASILDLPHLKSLHLEFYGRGAQMEKLAANHILLKHCPVAQWFAFQPMKLRKNKSKFEMRVTIRKLGETTPDLDTY